MATRTLKRRQTETRRAAQMMKRILIHFRGQMDEQLRPQGRDDGAVADAEGDSE